MMKRAKAEEAATVFMERYLYGPRSGWGGARGTHEALTRLYTARMSTMDMVVFYVLVAAVPLLLCAFALTAVSASHFSDQLDECQAAAADCMACDSARE